MFPPLSPEPYVLVSSGVVYLLLATYGLLSQCMGWYRPCCCSLSVSPWVQDFGLVCVSLVGSETYHCWVTPSSSSEFEVGLVQNLVVSHTVVRLLCNNQDVIVNLERLVQCPGDQSSWQPVNDHRRSITMRSSWRLPGFVTSHSRQDPSILILSQCFLFLSFIRPSTGRMNWPEREKKSQCESKSPANSKVL